MKAPGLRKNLILVLLGKVPSKSTFIHRLAVTMITFKFLLVISVLHFPRFCCAQFQCSLNDKYELCDSLYDNSTSVFVSAQRRNFGGKEPIDYPKALNAVFGAPGWLTQGLEAFSDINFHLLGYTALGKNKIKMCLLDFFIA